MLYGVKCKYCKFLCHKDCSQRAPPSCGLPDELVTVFVDKIKNPSDNSPLRTSRQDSVSTIKDFEISFNDFQCDKEISRGRYGCDIVKLIQWHGQCIAKEMRIPDLIVDDPNTRELVEDIYKRILSENSKARHDNLEMIMGACMEYPRLAIVTNQCTEHTLYDQIYNRRDKRLNLHDIINIAQQICLGMGFLHSRNIVHKDLKTKNIFIRSYPDDRSKKEKKVITVTILDFGLFPLKKICRMERKGNWLPIPKGWLPYVAPEIMRRLNPYDGPMCNTINFTPATDVYAFGTIWYELLTYDMPYKSTLPIKTIWQVGRGLKQPLVNLQAPREIKNILLICWSADRPTFPNLNNLLEAIPKKRVQRSSSFCLERCRF